MAGPSASLFHPNIFNDLLKRPDIMANAFANAMSGGDRGPAGGISGLGGGGQDASYQFLADTMQTGQPVTSLPRTGLLSFISPTVKADPRTQYMEQVLLHQKAADDFKTKIGAIGVFEDLVDQVGGDKAILMAPAVFGDILKDPDILQAFAGVQAKSRMGTEEARFRDQQTLQEQGFQDKLRYLDAQQEYGIGPFKKGAGKEPFEDTIAKGLFSSLMKPGANLDPTAINEQIDKAKKFIDIYSHGRDKDPKQAISDALDAIRAPQEQATTQGPGLFRRAIDALLGIHGGSAPLGTGTAEAAPDEQPSAAAMPSLGF